MPSAADNVNVYSHGKNGMALLHLESEYEAMVIWSVAVLTLVPLAS